jgi:hypothetical protein
MIWFQSQYVVYSIYGLVVIWGIPPPPPKLELYNYVNNKLCEHAKVSACGIPHNRECSAIVSACGIPHNRECSKTPAIVSACGIPHNRGFTTQ